EIAALGRLALLRFGGLARCHGLRLRRVRIDAGRRHAVILHACLASESHVEMLPDWVPIANDTPVKVYACFVPRLSAESKICVFFMYVARSVRVQSRTRSR